MHTDCLKILLTPKNYTFILIYGNRKNASNSSGSPHKVCNINMFNCCHLDCQISVFAFQEFFYLKPQGLLIGNTLLNTTAHSSLSCNSAPGLLSNENSTLSNVHFCNVSHCHALRHPILNGWINGRLCFEASA